MVYRGYRRQRYYTIDGDYLTAELQRAIRDESSEPEEWTIGHSFGNKLTGFLLFLLPLSVYAADVKYGASLVCISATVTIIKEIMNICKCSKIASGIRQGSYGRKTGPGS